MLAAAIEIEAMESMQAFRDYLCQYFSRPGAMTQGKVAENAGISRVFLNRVLQGHSEPTLPIAEKIATATGSSLATILRKSKNRAAVA